MPITLLLFLVHSFFFRSQSESFEVPTGEVYSWGHNADGQVIVFFFHTSDVNRGILVVGNWYIGWPKRTYFGEPSGWKSRKSLIWRRRMRRQLHPLLVQYFLLKILRSFLCIQNPTTCTHLDVVPKDNLDTATQATASSQVQTSFSWLSAKLHLQQESANWSQQLLKELQQEQSAVWRFLVRSSIRFIDLLNGSTQHMEICTIGETFLLMQTLVSLQMQLDQNTDSMRIKLFLEVCQITLETSTWSNVVTVEWLSSLVPSSIWCEIILILDSKRRIVHVGIFWDWQKRRTQRNQLPCKVYFTIPSFFPFDILLQSGRIGLSIHSGRVVGQTPHCSCHRWHVWSANLLKRRVYSLCSQWTSVLLGQ